MSGASKKTNDQTSDKPAKVMCCAKMFGGFGYKSNPCPCEAKIKRGGKPYCGVHDPEGWRAKQDKRDAENEVKRQAEARRNLEQDTCAGVSDDDLRKIIEGGGLAAHVALLVKGSTTKGRKGQS